jgi:crossover junction endodeoxyribonuclease RusA
MKTKQQSLAERQKKINDVYREAPEYPDKELRFTVDLPLSVNHMYVKTRGGGQRLSKLAEKYIQDVRAKILAVMEDENFPPITNASWHYLDLVFYMPDKRVRDSHNLIKLLLDALEKALFHNDYYIMPRIQSVEYDKHNPRTEALFKSQTEEDRKRARAM